jgi:cytidine deaminase
MSDLVFEELLAEARIVAESAYAPYSLFRVGAVAVAEDGRRFIGVNVENAAYGSTICAEATALASAATAGVRHVHTIAIAGLDAAECYPCGNCRQMMREFGVSRIIVQDRAGGHQLHTLEDLLPHSFGPDSLCRPLL